EVTATQRPKVPVSKRHIARPDETKRDLSLSESSTCSTRTRRTLSSLSEHANLAKEARRMHQLCFRV
ncbi:hypothetical protein A2U01_0097341, partial [Trifolium medium]|nr:hypothetical protein [Trifolium medium]